MDASAATRHALPLLDRVDARFEAEHDGGGCGGPFSPVGS